MSINIRVQDVSWNLNFKVHLGETWGRFMEGLLVAITMTALPFASLAEKKPGEAASLERVEIQGEVKPGGEVIGVDST